LTSLPGTIAASYSIGLELSVRFFISSRYVAYVYKPQV